MGRMTAVKLNEAPSAAEALRRYAVLARLSALLAEAAHRDAGAPPLDEQSHAAACSLARAAFARGVSDISAWSLPAAEALLAMDEVPRVGAARLADDLDSALAAARALLPA